MKRYINVADLYGILNEMDMLETYNDFIAVQRAINNTPTADVEEVVRCKDCEFCLKNDNDDYLCSAQTDPNYVTLEHYCSYGKRSK